MCVIVDQTTGLEKACLRTAEGTTAEIYLYGAHVVSFIPAGGEEVIFVSKEAIFKPPKAIRNTQFTVKEISDAQVVMQLVSDDVSVEEFPSGWTLLMTVTLSDDNGGTLKQTMSCVNGGKDELSTTQALHTYYRVSAIDDVIVHGLEGTPYLDNLAGRETKPGEAGPVTFSCEVDRIYAGAGCELVLSDGGRQVVICKEGFADVVLWNPWVDKSIQLSDFGDEEFCYMVCIEPANAAKFMAGESVTIKGGERWDASQTIHVRQV